MRFVYGRRPAVYQLDQVRSTQLDHFILFNKPTTSVTYLAGTIFAEICQPFSVNINSGEVKPEGTCKNGPLKRLQEYFLKLLKER